MCFEWTSKDHVRNGKEGIAVEREELIMKKDMKYKEILRKNIYKKNSPPYET